MKKRSGSYRGASREIRGSYQGANREKRFRPIKPGVFEEPISKPVKNAYMEKANES
jgi:hypothetical protein